MDVFRAQQIKENKTNENRQRKDAVCYKQENSGKRIIELEGAKE